MLAGNDDHNADDDSSAVQAVKGAATKNDASSHALVEGLKRILPGRSGPPDLVREVLREGDLIPDNRLGADASDLLEHEAIAKSVAEIALTAQTPVNIALFGAWGSGKSSIYTMVKRHLVSLTAAKATVVRYDAWKYGGKELKRNFVDSIAKDLGLGNDPELGEGLHRPIRKVRLNFGQWMKDNAGQFFVGLLVALFAAAVFAIALAGVSWLTTSTPFREALMKTLPTTGAVLAPAILAVLLGPKVLEGVTVTTETPAPEEADQFADRFRKLIGKARTSKRYPLVVFIDELDRCAPDEVVSTLRDLKTFLDEPDCAIIVAADRDVIVRALRQEIDQARPVREDEPYYATPGAYLDKIFQHQITLPPLRAKALTEFARTLTDAQADGIWAELRTAGPDWYDRVIFALVPVHVRSPRRVKVLLNNFATNARVAQARGLDWLDRAQELAVLTVLQTEFPTVIQDLRRVPKMLAYLRGEEAPAAEEVERICAQHRSDNSTQFPEQSAAETPSEDEEYPVETSDELITDKASTPEDRQGASLTLRRQLHNYLRKVRAAGLPDPRPDLLYLRPAANRELLPDPALGDAIDFATDTDPKQTTEVFANQPSHTIAIAIPLIVIEGEQAHGLGRQFALEAACRLAERLEPAEHSHVATQVAPVLVSSLVANELTDDSLPGAVLLASAAGAAAAKDALENIQRLPADISSRLASVAPFLTDEEADLVATACVANFVDTPEPLLSLLRESSVERAIAMWEEAADKVVTALNDLELPPSAEPKVAASRTVGQAAAAAKKPEPTGDGVALMELLIAVAVERTDGEPLLSAIFASFQVHPAKGPFVQWSYSNAEKLVAPMNSSVLRARHALLGITAFTSSGWKAWAKHLPAPTKRTNPDIEALASQVVLEKIFPAFTDGDGQLTKAELADLLVRVAAWAQLEEGEVARAIQPITDELPWDGNDDPWAARVALYSAVDKIVELESGDGPVGAVIAADLAACLTTLEVDEDLVDNFVDIASGLPAALREHLADHVEEESEPTEAEAAEGFRLQLELRRLTSRNAVPATELLALESPSTKVVDAWLALNPSVAEAKQIVGQRQGTVRAMGAYARALSPEERTILWVAASAASVSDGLLRAIGQHGVGSGAVEHCQQVVAGQTQQSERRATVARLRTASPVEGSNHAVAALRRAAAELATDLLGQSGGDLRTASDLMVWAGGSSPRGDAELRRLFDREAESHSNVLTKGLISQLQGLGLLSRRKSWLEKVLDR